MGKNENYVFTILGLSNTESAADSVCTIARFNCVIEKNGALGYQAGLP